MAEISSVGRNGGGGSGGGGVERGKQSERVCVCVCCGAALPSLLQCREPRWKGELVEHMCINVHRRRQIPYS